MPDISVPWGDSLLNIALPEHWTLQQVARSSLRPATDDWAHRMAAALDQPVSGLPLAKLLAARRGGRISIVVEDLTRHSPLHQILPIVLREIEHADIPRERIEFVFATGMHPPLTAEQAAAKVGPEAAAYAWRCSNSRDPKASISLGKAGRVKVWVDRGVAKSDLRIIVSSVSPHLQAGFGGGYKMLVPGCAGQDTIREIHRLGLGRKFRQLAGGDGQSNPMRTVIDQAGQMVDAHHGTTFALQYLLDDNNMPSSVAAGEPLAAQQMLAKQCAVACGVVIPQGADVLITSAHPRDYDLWQSFKCIPNTLWAARPDGVIICLARSPAGVDGMEVPQVSFSPTWARRIVRWLGPQTLPSLLIRMIPSLAGDAAFFVRLAIAAIHRNPICMVSPALVQEGLKFPGLQVYEHVEQALAFARRHLGDGPQKVVVFPSGGTTYPIPPTTPADRRTMA